MADVDSIQGSCFAVNACVPITVGHFQHGFVIKGDGIKYVVRNGTDTFYIFSLPDSDQRLCGASVPIGFGPCGWVEVTRCAIGMG